MELYNSIIKGTLNLLSSYTPRNLAVHGEATWEMCESNELILSKDAAFELGANRLPSVNYSCVTTSEELVERDEILLYGEDLNEIKKDVPFARIVLININDLGDDDKAYKAIKNLDYVKYDIIPKGYMIRASSFDKREQVRVSKEAVSKSINFETIGNLYINKLKEDKLVKAVTVIFITENIPEFKALTQYANKIHDITQTLNHVLNNIDLDCKSCSLKPICDEVEGMRELHSKQWKENIGKSN